MVRYALILIFLSFVNLFLANTPNLKKRVNLSETNESEEADKYYLHKEIKATVFWIGEEESEENDYISNRESIWDKAWLENYGGVDDPKNRNGFYPAAFIPKQNPFYVALPYSDIVDSKKVDSVSEIPWYAEEVNENVSQVKNRWLKVIHGGNVCYAQWEDAGPGVYDDFDYVFGKSLPKNRFGVNAGIDISPAVKDCLQVGGISTIDWVFVDDVNVPLGPWQEIITRDL